LGFILNRKRNFMKRMLFYVSIALVACMIVVGCQKKVTKAQDTVQKPTHVVGPGTPPRN
jgi:hypothetical protein